MFNVNYFNNFSFIPFISYGSELTDEETKTGISRYTVLVIDVSGSMRGTPMTTLKSAANKFVTIF